MENDLSLLARWRKKLLEEISSVIKQSCADHPPRFRSAMLKAAETARPAKLGLLACGAARWCGGTYDDGMPAAVASHLLRAAVTAHITLPGFNATFGMNAVPLWEEFDEATAILAGDALIPLAVSHIVENCGRHTADMVGDAMNAMGGKGVLAGISLEQQQRTKTLADDTDTWELWGGRLASFAAASGARMAGASERQLDQISLMGLDIGRACCMIGGAAGVNLNSRSGQELHQEALSVLDEAKILAGSGEEGMLLREIIGYFRNCETGDPFDLFF